MIILFPSPRPKVPRVLYLQVKRYTAQEEADVVDEAKIESPRLSCRISDDNLASKYETINN